MTKTYTFIGPWNDPKYRGYVEQVARRILRGTTATTPAERAEWSAVVAADAFQLDIETMVERLIDLEQLGPRKSE